MTSKSKLAEMYNYNPNHRGIYSNCKFFFDEENWWKKNLTVGSNKRIKRLLNELNNVTSVASF